MNSEDNSKTHTVPDDTVTTSGDSGMPDYDEEGFGIIKEGAKEGLMYPGPDSDYPLRDPSEDPGWAVKIVAIWAGITVFCIAFILALMILGIWYD